MQCKACGAYVNDGNMACPNCGKPVNSLSALVANVKNASSPTDETQPAPDGTPPAAPAPTPPSQPSPDSHEPSSSKRSIAGPVIITAAIVVAAIIVGIVAFNLLSANPSASTEETDTALEAPQPSTEPPTQETPAVESEVPADDTTADNYRDFGWFRITLPSDRPTMRVSDRIEDGSVTIWDGDTPVATIDVAALRSKSSESKTLNFDLGAAHYNGRSSELQLKDLYLTDEGTIAHWSNRSATADGLTSVLGMTPEELAGLIQLKDGEQWVPATCVATYSYTQTAPNTATESRVSSSSSAPFWGVWIAAAKSESELSSYEAAARASGFNPRVIMTTEWSNLNPEPWYALTTGSYGSESSAETQCAAAIDAGFSDAYVKYAGDYIG